MKLVKAVIRSEMLDEVKNNLQRLGYAGLTVYEVRGRGRQQGISWRIRGNEFRLDLIPKLMVEVVVDDADVADVVEELRKSAYTGSIGDGKIFVIPVEDAVRIRTGERGAEALK
ncbi:MAG: P-II family nitrogen regulator [Candidatus Caldarchaeum sp.]|nr:P-II family nitrogen regulator [Candidatus Caldarchaeum sp.]MCX8200555.1 P-II family nitrogen regulator [Candidatus Caldarchaeum sp.]MDW8434620.1 P-II family nitrogen regulator [Candidatus Caldarchaeum sp.]